MQQEDKHDISVRVSDLLDVAKNTYGVTLRRISEISGISESALSNYMRRGEKHRNPTSRTIEKIAIATRRAVDEQVEQYRKLQTQYLREQSRYPFFRYDGTVSQESPAPSPPDV